MATGRSLFARFGLVIDIICGASRLMPAFVFKMSWWFVEGAPGKIGMFLRYLYAKRLAKICGANVMIGKYCTVKRWENLELGSNVTIHVGSYIDASGGIKIGENVSIAHSVSILSFEHTWDDLSQPIKYNPLSFCPVTIHDDVWIGCGARILSGALINSRTVIAAGAIVLRGGYGPGVYGGVPAKLLKSTAVLKS